MDVGFCDECGAALTTQVSYCPVCRKNPTAWSIRAIEKSAGNTNKTNSTSSGSSYTNRYAGLRLTQRYIILKEIGTGGFGVVYLALDRYNHNQPVAIKQINLRNLSPSEMIQATDSFNREVSLLNRLKHQHLPQLIDHFTDQEHWYIVMTFIDGETLEDHIKKHPGKCLPLRQVIKIGLELCNVLQYLHNQHPSVIFRDVKPGNIMYTQKKKMYLIDFGIARLFRAGKTRDTGALGSPGYAAPEQYGKARTTPQTDIYGFGATLQTLLTGLEPPDFLAHPEISRYTRRIPVPLRPLLQRMMANDPEERPSLAEVRARLEHFRDYELTAQKMKHTLVPIQKIASSALIWQLLIIGILTVALLGDAIFIPMLLLILSIVMGRTAKECHIEIAWSQNRLPWRKLVAIVGSNFKQVLPLSCLIMLYCCLLAQSSEKIWAAGYILIFFVIFCMCAGYLLYWICRLGVLFFRIRNKPVKRQSYVLQQQIQQH